MFNIRALEDHDIPLMVTAFSQIGWNKPASRLGSLGGR